ncbi:MAG: hypothetical protein ACPG31_08225 [Planctomycetota bacterium]
MVTKTTALLALTLTSLSCAGLSFQNQRTHLEPPARVVQAIRPGEVDLQFCLVELGAPTSVQRSEDGSQHVLTWAWHEQGGWGFFVSAPVGDTSASFNWSDQENQPNFLRLFFDRDWMLIDVAQG